MAAPVSLPFIPRNPMPINSAFGKRPLYNDFHSGIDFNSATNAPGGASIRAAGAGKVVESYNGNSPGQSAWAKLRGTMVVIDHGTSNGVHWKTRYHMLVPNSNIPVGTIVQAGDIIGKVGNSGSSGTGAHLHFELWKDGVAVNPLSYLAYRPEEFNRKAGSGATPINNTPPAPIFRTDEMLNIRNPKFGDFIVGPGYVKHSSNPHVFNILHALDSERFHFISVPNDHIVAILNGYSGVPENEIPGAGNLWVNDAVGNFRLPNGHRQSTVLSSIDRKADDVLATGPTELKVDTEALAAALAPQLVSPDAATKDDVAEALRGLTLTAQ